MLKKIAKMSVAIAVALTTTSVFAANLKVGTEATYAPFEFLSEKGEITGFDIDIINAIAKAEGLKVEIVNMPFDGLIPSLLTSQIDVALAAISITEERQKRVDFSEAYYDSGLSALIRDEDKENFKTIDSLKNQRLCAQLGTTGAIAADKLSPNNVVKFNTQPEAFLELKNKGCVAVINDRPVNLYFLAKNNAKGVVEIAEKLNGEQYGIAVKKGNKEILDKLNSGLKKIKESGEFKKIHEKWFSVSE